MIGRILLSPTGITRAKRELTRALYEPSRYAGAQRWSIRASTGREYDVLAIVMIVVEAR